MDIIKSESIDRYCKILEELSGNKEFPKDLERFYKQVSPQDLADAMYNGTKQIINL